MRPFRSTAAPSGVLILLATLAMSPATPGDEPAKKPRGPANRLARETSPYLLLHAHNPVDWHPWGPEAFAKAKAEGKPIFLSVGYSACYWCHVMERESFTDAGIAGAINAGFVAIKVDREERPDVDQIYMTAVQAFSGGSGGWPMSVFLTPDGRPFFGGTYFPPKEFAALIKAVGEAWRDQRPALEKDADALADAVRRSTAGPLKGPKVPLTRDLAAGGRAGLAEQFDPEFGGFGFDPARPNRPKFPEPVNLVYLLDQARRDRAAGVEKKAGPGQPLAMALKTLDAMARGGIRDHLAGGYHRYSTVRDWSVPHFEKMLYDNAQVAEALVLAFEETGDPRHSAEADATFAFVARTLTAPDGLFYSALDAETDGEEGKYYVWTRAEAGKALGPDFATFAPPFGLDRKPNFEGDRYVLLRRDSDVNSNLEARLAPICARLLAARDRRPAPMLDDKVLTSWNALMIAAQAEGYRVLKDERLKVAAGKAADALLATMRTAEGRLLRTSRGGPAKLPAYLEDYAFLVHALLRLHAAAGDPARLAQARALADRMIADFADAKDGGFFYTATDHEALLARPKDPFDNAIPGANAVAIRALVALGVATAEPRYLDHAGKALAAFAPTLAARPAASPLMLTALGEYLDARPSGRAPEATPPLPGAPGVVTADARRVGAGPLAPGAEFEVEITLKIKPGYHIYANPAGTEDVIPTVITLAPGPKADLAGVRYPAGESKVLAAGGTARVAVYEREARLTARVRLAGDAPSGDVIVNIRVRHQACDDRACLAPATLELPVRVEVGKR